MTEIMQQITPHLVAIASAFLVGLASYLGTKVKLWLDSKQKRSLAEATVRYVEQVGKTLGSEEKFTLAVTKLASLLQDAHISVSATEIEVLIESAVNAFTQKYDAKEEE